MDSNEFLDVEYYEKVAQKLMAKDSYIELNENEKIMQAFIVIVWVSKVFRKINRCYFFI
jgi:hypothetical protein